MKTRQMTDYEKKVFSLFQSAKSIDNPQKISTINLVIDRIVEHKEIYETTGKPYGIPFWFLGCLHYRESSSIFERHLHNGDPLTARTVHVPIGRPVNGNPPFTWGESAADALSMRGYQKLTEWDLVSSLVRAEAWNGFFYRNHNLISPYIWSYTNHYSSGKFASDGKFDPNLIDEQPGVAAICLNLQTRGIDLNVMSPS